MLPRALRHHRDADLLAQVPHRRDVDLHGLAEVVHVLVLHGHRMAHPGVVDEDVHGPRALYHLGHQPLALVGQLRVRGDGDGAGQVADERGQALLTAGGHDDGRAGGVEHAGEALAQPVFEAPVTRATWPSSRNAASGSMVRAAEDDMAAERRGDHTLRSRPAWFGEPATTDQRPPDSSSVTRANSLPLEPPLVTQ